MADVQFKIKVWHNQYSMICNGNQIQENMFAWIYIYLRISKQFDFKGKTDWLLSVIILTILTFHYVPIQSNHQWWQCGCWTRARQPHSDCALGRKLFSWNQKNGYICIILFRSWFFRGNSIHCNAVLDIGFTGFWFATWLKESLRISFPLWCHHWGKNISIYINCQLIHKLHDLRLQL